LTDSGIEGLHSIPHNESLPDTDSLLNDLTLTHVNVTTPLESDTCASIGNYPNDESNEEEGEEVLNHGQEEEVLIHETPPLTITEKNG
jgi:hypothetical protein